MTTPEVDQELERLFSAARVATAPGAGARERIRAGLLPRLATDAAATRPAWGPHAWLGAALAVLGVCGFALWLTSAPPAKDVSAPVTTPASAPSSLVAPPPLASAAASAAAPAVELVRPSPSLASSKPPAPSAPSVNPAEELALVRAMQQALRAGNPSQALALTADHTRRFPRGTLVEEREGVRAVARCQLAAPDARAALLAAFTQRFATSPYAARVKAACQ
jgi:hypothetical protein